MFPFNYPLIGNHQPFLIRLFNINHPEEIAMDGKATQNEDWKAQLEVNLQEWIKDNQDAIRFFNVITTKWWSDCPHVKECLTEFAEIKEKGDGEAIIYGLNSLIVYQHSYAFNRIALKNTPPWLDCIDSEASYYYLINSEEVKAFIRNQKADIADHHHLLNKFHGFPTFKKPLGKYWNSKTNRYQNDPAPKKPR